MLPQEPMRQIEEFLSRITAKALRDAILEDIGKGLGPALFGGFVQRIKTVCITPAVRIL